MAVVTEALIHASPALADAFVETAEQLRRATVQVRGTHGPGGGSGVIWDADGIIITNAHVARGPDAAVTLADGRTFAATVAARDDARDLAALRVDTADLPAAVIGDSDSLRVGALVLAVGNPLGLTGAVTTGVIHAIGAHEGPHRHAWVRADVRLAPGNSGGPLADAQGRVIGVNSMIAGGLALAVPSNAVARFLRAGAGRPALGVTLHPVRVPVGGADTFGLLVTAVAAGGAAEAAGVIPGDVLIGTEGAPFARSDSLLRTLAEREPGGALALEIIRGGQPLTVAVRLDGQPPDEALAA